MVNLVWLYLSMYIYFPWVVFWSLYLQVLCPNYVKEIKVCRVNGSKKDEEKGAEKNRSHSIRWHCLRCGADLNVLIAPAGKPLHLHQLSPGSSMGCHSHHLLAFSTAPWGHSLSGQLAPDTVQSGTGPKIAVTGWGRLFWLFSKISVNMGVFNQQPASLILDKRVVIITYACVLRWNLSVFTKAWYGSACGHSTFQLSHSAAKMSRRKYSTTMSAENFAWCMNMHTYKCFYSSWAKASNARCVYIGECEKKWD